MSFSRDRFSSSSDKIRRTKDVATRWRTLSEKSKQKMEDSQDNEDRSLLNARVKNVRSQESLIVSPPGMHSIDLSAPNVEVKPLHSSVLGQGHFFHVATSQGSKYISCTTTEERDNWLSSLRRTIRPQEEHSRRSDSSLKVWIVEAKNVTPKRRYFCDILLDQTLYAKTSVKTMTDMLFWGEHFEFKNLPAVEFITVNLYREADKKKKKDKNMLVGYISLSLAEMENSQIIEKWITCHSGTVGKSGKEAKSDLPIIRLKARRQTVNILPLEYYQSFIKYLTCDYKELCQILEPVLAVREKEDFATCLVHILQKQGKACEFLSDVVMEEISRLDDEHLTFRGNSIATKAMEAYMKLVGEKYLQGTLGDLIQQLVQSPDDCEVDPTKVATPQLLSCQQKNLDMYSNMAWVKVINSFCYFPIELREVFTSFRSRCTDRSKGDYSDNLISGCIFLRFLCPAILYPSLFNLTQEYPNERASRNLTLIAKTIQTLANFTQFGIKEEYMTFMNAFVEREAPNMKIFLLKISSGEASNQFLEFDGHIDLGKELSVLHTLLLECTQKHSETAGKQLENLNKILSSLTSSFDDPTVGQKKPSRQSHIYDNLMSTPTQTKELPQAPIQAPSSPTKMENTVLMSPTEVLIDMLHHCGESTDDLPALAGRGKSSSNSQGTVSRSNVSEVTHGSPSAKRLIRLAETRSVSVIGPDQVYNERAKKKSLIRMASAADDLEGDYVDLLPLLDDSAHNLSDKEKSNKTNSQPLAFANPLFRHQQQVQQSRQGGFKAGGFETHHGIAVSQAQTVQRLSSDSSISSNEDGEDVPWQVMLVKTSSPLAASVSPDQHSSNTPLQNVPEIHNSSSRDIVNEQSLSSISNSSFYTCSSDVDPSASTSFISPSPSLQSSSSAVSMNGCSTFPRRRRVQQEQSNNTSSPLPPNESKNTSLGEANNSTPVSHMVSTFQRQFSNPCHESIQNTNQSSQLFPNKASMEAQKTVPDKQQNFHGVKSAPGVLSSLVDISNQRRNKKNDHHALDIISSERNTSSSSAASFNYSSSTVHQRLDGNNIIGSPVNLRASSSSSPVSTTTNTTAGSVNYKGMAQKPPTLITKSVGWQIAHRVERSSSHQESSSSNDSSPQSLVLSPHNSMSSMHESSSAHSISSPTSPSEPWGYMPSRSDSNSSISSLNKMQQRISAQSDSSGSLGGLNFSRTSQTSSSSISSLSSGNNNSSRFTNPAQFNNSRDFQNNPSLAAFTRRLSSTSDTQIHAVSLHSNPLPPPPLFLVSKYAVVRPNTANPIQNPRSARAASYHSPEELTKSGSRTPLSFTTSRSLDLGYLGKQIGETVKPASTESTLKQPSGGQSPVGSSSNWPLTDKKSIQSASSTTNSATNSRLSQQSTVHAGINSVLRQLQEQEKTKQGYEQEVHILRQQLLEAQERLQLTEVRLLDHEMEIHKLMDEWQSRLVESEKKMKRQQAEKDEQMKTIIMRLHSIEEELKREHAEMVIAVEHKQQVIEVQERRIQKHDQANKRLLQALADLNGRAANVAADENSNSSSSWNEVFENNEIAGFRKSSC